jgi:hypothetical protein
MREPSSRLRTSTVNLGPKRPRTTCYAEQIEATNRRQDEANNRLADEIHDLGHKFDDFRLEVAEKLGAINANLESFRGRTETSFKVAIWALSLASVVAISVLSSVIVGTWYAAKLDSRVQQLEKHAAANHGAKGAR